MKHSLLALSCIPFAVSALKIPVRQTKRSSFGVAQSGTVNAGSSSGGQILGLTDNKDLIYIANVTIAGQSYPVQLDTGSSDLWVNAGNSVPGKQSNINYNLTYGIGYAYGPIATAPVSFAGFDVPSQAYLAGQQVDNPAVSFGAQGVLGTGFTSLSGIDMQVNQTGGSWGRCLLYNIFAQSPSEPNFMAFSLQRDDDPNQDVKGSFTIGEYAQDYAAVANTAPIPTYPEKSPNRWTVLVDQIVANGKKLSLSSVVKNVPSSKAVGLLDTGTSFVYAPTAIVTAIYGSIPGATYSSSLAQWIVPCDAEVDVSIVIGGRQFDIHPLDTVQPTESDAQTCTGSWLPQTLSVGQSEFDFLLGDAVLRSLYTVYDFGDFDSNNNMGDPYVRLWSLVNGSDASAEFHQVRGGTANNTFLSNNDVNAASSSANSLNSTSTTDPSSDVGDLQTKVNNIIKWAPYVLGLVGLNVLILLVVLIVTIVGCVRRRKNARVAGPPSGSYIQRPLGGQTHDYRPISLQSTLQNDPSQAYETPKYGAGARYSD